MKANGHLGSVKALCEAGADVNQAATHDGSTPLFMACQMGHSSVVDVEFITHARICAQ